jgi:hypothetical protein
LVLTHSVLAMPDDLIACVISWYSTGESRVEMNLPRFSFLGSVGLPTFPVSFILCLSLKICISRIPEHKRPLPLPRTNYWDYRSNEAEKRNWLSFLSFSRTRRWRFKQSLQSILERAAALDSSSPRALSSSAYSWARVTRFNSSFSSNVSFMG